MKFISITKLSAIGKGAIGLILSLGALIQMPSIGVPLTSFAAKHHHIAGAIALITVMTAFLSNPQVQKIFGVSIDPGDKLNVKNPAIAPDGTLTADSATLQKSNKP